MTATPPIVKLCINCRHFVGRDCTHESNMRYSFVDGKFGPFNSVMFVRLEERRPDGSLLCGKAGRFHDRAPDPNGYAEVAIRSDQRDRHEGRADDFGVSACGRSDRAGQ